MDLQFDKTQLAHYITWMYIKQLYHWSTPTPGHVGSGWWDTLAEHVPRFLSLAVGQTSSLTLRCVIYTVLRHWAKVVKRINLNQSSVIIIPSWFDDVNNAMSQKRGVAGAARRARRGSRSWEETTPPPSPNPPPRTQYRSSHLDTNASR